MDKLIQETDVERRNLMMMSLLIIIFNLADGTVKDNVLALPLISIQFHNPHALIVIAWTMLSWFILRFWQKNKTVFISKIHEYISANHNKRYVERYVEKKLNKKVDGEKITNIYFDGRNCLDYVEQESSFGDMENKYMYMHGFSFYIFMIINHLKAYINSDAITSYFMPYIFALLAIASPFIKI